MILLEYFLEYFPALLGFIIALYGLLILIASAMYVDAKKRGHSYNLWLLLTLVFGITGIFVLALSRIEPVLLRFIVGLMLYLLVPLTYVIAR